MTQITGQEGIAEQYEFIMLRDAACSGETDCRKWPRDEWELCRAAINRMWKSLPAGSFVVRDRTQCGWRHELSGIPWQLYRCVTIKRGGVA